MFVIVATGRLAKRFAHAVVGVGSDWDSVVDSFKTSGGKSLVVTDSDPTVWLVHFKITDGVVGACEYDSLHTMLTSGFVDVVGGRDVVLQHIGPGGFDRGVSGEVNYSVDAYERFRHRVVVRSIGDEGWHAGRVFGLSGVER